MSNDIVPVGIQFDTNAGPTARSIDEVGAASKRTERSLDGLAASERRVAQAGTSLTSSAGATTTALSRVSQEVARTALGATNLTGSLGGATDATSILSSALSGGMLVALGAVVVAGNAAINMWNGMVEVSERTKHAIDEHADATEAYIKAARAAQNATGELKRMLDEDTEAARRNAEEKKNLALRNLEVAKSALAVAQAQLPQNSKFDLNGTATDAGAAAAVVAGRVARGAQVQVDAAAKGLREQEKAVLALQQQIESGGRGALAALQRQNAEFGKTPGQIILMRAEIEASKPANAAFASQIRDAAYLAAQHADAEDRRARAIRGSTRAAKEAVQPEFNVYELALAQRNQGRAAAAQIIDIKPRLDLSQVNTDLGELEVRFDQSAADFTSAFMDAAGQVAWEFDSVFNSFAQKDWMRAFSGLFYAVETFKQKWNSTEGGGRIGAVAGLASSAGSAVGGSVGAGLVGAAGGAMAGLSAAPLLAALGPVGVIAGVGAAIGGLLGIFGSSKAKKAEQAAAAKQAADEAAARQQEILNQGREIEVERLRLSGQGLASLNMQREIERAGIAAENLARYDELVALRDANSLRLMNIELLKAEGKTADAQAMERADVLLGQTAAEQEVQKQIWATVDANNALANSMAAADEAISQAQSDLNAARQAEAGVLRDQAQAAQSTLSRLQGITKGLTDFRNGLGDTINGLSLAGARAAFRDVDARGRLGDLDAQERAVGIFNDLLTVSKASARSEIAYMRDVADTKASSEAMLAVAGRQASMAQRQLDAANAQIKALETVNGSVLSVYEAQERLNSALAAKLQLTMGAKGLGAANNNNAGGGFDFASNPVYLGDGRFGPSTVTAADLARAEAAGIGDTWGEFDSGFARGLIDQYRQGGFDHLVDGAGNPTGLNAMFKAAGFAAGGYHSGGARIVGENGPELEVTGASRIFSNSQTRQMFDNSELVAEIRALREQNASQAADIKRMADKVASLEANFSGVSENGRVLRTKAVA